MSELPKLAEEHFLDLSEVEKRFLQSVAAELQADLSEGEENRRNPLEAGAWRERQLIRAALVRWMLTDPIARESLPTTGIDVRHALIDGDLLLQHAKIEQPVRFIRCQLATVDIRFSDLAFASFGGSVVEELNAAGSKIASNLELNEGFRSRGLVTLDGIEIGQDLNCDGATLEPSEGGALLAGFCRVNGSVKLGRGFSATGFVNLMRSRIDGDLDCSGGQFTAGIKDAKAEKKETLPYALALDGAKIGGGLLLRHGFVANGEVRLLGAEVKGQVSCRGGSFLQDGTGHAFTAEGAQIAGTLWLGAALEGKEKTTFRGSIYLASCGVLAVACNPEAIDESARGDLDGFQYRRVHFLRHDTVSQSPDARLCKLWLAFATRAGFSRQPYSQLAAVLRTSGDDELADEIMIDMHRTRHRELSGGWGRVASKLFDVFLGYGYRPRYCLAWLAGLLVTGTLVFLVGNEVGAVVQRPPQVVFAPSASTALAPTKQSSSRPVTFDAFIFSLETLVPVADLGQKRKWDLSDDRSMQVAPFRWYFYLHSILGPLLAALFSVGLTGLVRKG